MKKIEISRLNLGEFMELIDSISKIDNFISLRIESEFVKSSVYFPDRDALKKLTIPTETFFEVKGEISESVKLCFFDGQQINSILKRFVGPAVISATIKVEQGESGDYQARSITVRNEELTIQIQCANPDSGWVEIPEDVIDGVFDSSGAEFEFELTGSQKSKFEDLMKIDIGENTFSIAAKDDGVYLSGKSYDYLVSEKAPETQAKQFLFKKFFTVLDKDDYTVRVADDKSFFESQQRDVKIVFANCES